MSNDDKVKALYKKIKITPKNSDIKKDPKKRLEELKKLMKAVKGSVVDYVEKPIV